MYFKTLFPAASLIALSMLTTPALAYGADGSWKCIANGNIPIATLSVSGSSYDIQTSDGKTGSGDLDISGDSLVPQSGPLVDEFEVTGSLQNNVLYWNNSAGTLMACWPR